MAFYTVALSSLLNSEEMELAFLITSGCSSKTMWLFIVTFKTGVKEETPEASVSQITTGPWPKSRWAKHSFAGVIDNLH